MKNPKFVIKLLKDSPEDIFFISLNYLHELHEDFSIDLESSRDLYSANFNEGETSVNIDEEVTNLNFSIQENLNRDDVYNENLSSYISYVNQAYNDNKYLPEDYQELLDYILHK